MSSAASYAAPQSSSFSPHHPPTGAFGPGDRVRTIVDLSEQMPVVPAGTDGTVVSAPGEDCYVATFEIPARVKWVESVSITLPPRVAEDVPVYRHQIKAAPESPPGEEAERCASEHQPPLARALPLTPPHTTLPGCVEVPSDWSIGTPRMPLPVAIPMSPSAHATGPGGQPPLAAPMTPMALPDTDVITASPMWRPCDGEAASIPPAEPLMLAPAAPLYPQPSPAPPTPADEIPHEIPVCYDGDQCSVGVGGHNDAEDEERFDLSTVPSTCGSDYRRNRTPRTPVPAEMTHTHDPYATLPEKCGRSPAPFHSLSGRSPACLQQPQRAESPAGGGSRGSSPFPVARHLPRAAVAESPAAWGEPIDALPPADGVYAAHSAPSPVPGAFGDDGDAAGGEPRVRMPALRRAVARVPELARGRAGWAQTVRTAVQEVAEAAWPDATAKICGAAAAGFSLPDMPVTITVEHCESPGDAATVFRSQPHMRVAAELKGDEPQLRVVISLGDDDRRQMTADVTFARGRSAARAAWRALDAELRPHPAVRGVWACLCVIAHAGGCDDPFDGGVPADVLLAMALHAAQQAAPGDDEAALLVRALRRYAAFDFASLSVNAWSADETARGAAHAAAAAFVADPAAPSRNLAAAVSVGQLHVAAAEFDAAAAAAAGVADGGAAGACPLSPLLHLCPAADDMLRRLCARRGACSCR